MLIRITKEEIERIKGSNPLAAIVFERGIKLSRRGRHLFALCPFHQESTPSFVITKSKGLFHCFGCGIAGDVIGFVIRHDKVSFPDAVRMLAMRAGVALETAEARPKPCDPYPSIPGEDLCGRRS